MPNSAHSPQNTTKRTAFDVNNANLARRLLLALIVFCAAMMLLGPTIADYVLSLLGCTSGQGCGSIANAIGSRFAVFYGADSLGDVPFIFITNFWWMILAWVALIAYVRLRKPPPVTTPQDARREQSVAFRWAHRSAWGSFISLVVFCVLLGVPVLATFTAGFILSQLGCETTVLNFGGPQTCLDAPGFWTTRLRDYMSPVGWLLAPLLLVKNFFVLLIGWATFTAALFYISSLMKQNAKG